MLRIFFDKCKHYIVTTVKCTGDFFKKVFLFLKNIMVIDLETLNSIVKRILSICFIQYALGFIISLYSRFVYKTSKIIVKGHTEDYLNSLQKNNSNAAFTWHGRIFSAGVFIEKLTKKISYKGNLLTVASKHKDGNLASITLSFFGFKKIEGSSVGNRARRAKNDSGAFNSALRILKEFRGNNSSIFIALDGPKGPRFKINSNIVGLAQKTETTVFPVVISYSKKKEFKSWDRFQLPLPFSKIMFEFLEPIKLEKNLNVSELEEKIELDMNKHMEENDKEICKK